MGYYAHAEQYDEFVVTDPSAVLDALAAAEKTENKSSWGTGHISWCHPVATYRASAGQEYTDTAERDAHALCEMLIDFGFECEIGDRLIVTGWGGDKIGSSWDTVWASLGNGKCRRTHEIPDHDMIVWIMRGEDDTVWAEILTADDHSQASVKVSYEVQA